MSDIPWVTVENPRVRYGYDAEVFYLSSEGPRPRMGEAEEQGPRATGSWRKILSGSNNFPGSQNQFNTIR